MGILKTPSRLAFWRREKKVRTRDDFPTVQLTVLALCRVAEPIALTSILPYGWLLAKGFHVGREEDASVYAGLLIASFALAETLTGMFWGGVSDRIGRKPVLMLGMTGTMVSSLMIGLAPNYAVALVGRLVGGSLNGNVGVIQTMVGEMVHKPEHEPRAYTMIPFVWSIGTIIGPAVGGTFANPVKGFPETFHKGTFWEKFPWLLPNLICAVFVCLSMTVAYFLLEETHPDLRKDGLGPVLMDDDDEETTETPAADEHAPLIPASVPAPSVAADNGVDLRQEFYGATDNTNNAETSSNKPPSTKEERWESSSNTGSRTSSNATFASKSKKVKWCTWAVAMLVTNMGFFCFYTMWWDHLLPIFLQEERVPAHTKINFVHIPGGLGMTTKAVGLIMAINGVIELIIQAFVSPFFAKHLGIRRVFILTTVLYPLVYFVIPYIAVLPEKGFLPGIYIVLVFRNIFSLLQYPALLILLKKACPCPSALGRINGLSASVSAGSRTVAAPIAGVFYSWGIGLGFIGTAWWAGCVVAILCALQLLLIPNIGKDDDDSEEAGPMMMGH